MWPLLLDNSEEECMKILRRLELEAYGSLVSALRAQGGLTPEKLKILKDTATALHITPERHRAEIRRAVNDEQLCTIAQFAEGPDTYAEWSVEGRRKVRLVPRVVPQTAFLAVARRVADVVQADNAKLPWPAATARPPSTKTPQPPLQVKYEHEDRVPPTKKRRRLSQDSLPPPAYVPSVAKHRLQKHGISKIQQMYKSQSRMATMRQQQSLPSSQQESSIMPPPRTTIKTIPPVKQRQEVTKVSTVNASPSSSSCIDSNLDATQKNQHAVTVAKVIQSTGTSVNKSLIKISQNQHQQPPQKLVIVSASQPVNSNIIQQTGTNKIITPINTLKIKSIEDTSEIPAKTPKILSSQVIVSKSQLTPLQTLNTGEKPKVLTVQAKVRPQGSIILPLQGQNSSTSGQFAGVSVPVLHGLQWKAIQGKSTVKLLPISGNTKIIQKSGTVGSAPIYVMSKPSNIVVNKTSVISTTSADTNVELTKTISNITHIRPLTQKTEDGNKVLVVRKASPIVTTTTAATPTTLPNQNSVSSTVEEKEDLNTETTKEERKSTVLQDALRASGVTPADDDIESQISQFTVIPKNKSWSTASTEEPPISKPVQNIQLQDTKFLTLEEAVAILGDNSETRALLSHLQVESSTTSDGQLDPQTGVYSPVLTNTKSQPPPPQPPPPAPSNVNTSEERIDIFSTAIASANIQLENNDYYENDVVIENSECDVHETTINESSVEIDTDCTSVPLTDKQLTDILTGEDSNR